jgi:ABC-type molybdenum transport system ATPase subunit/photorepair protein PhrA
MMDLGVVIDDEGLNGVDDVGIERLLEFILEKNGDKLFFFVGHQKKVHDYFAGCNNLHIVKEDGDSKITLRKMEAA